MNEVTFNMIEEASNYIKSKIDVMPQIGLILGSGLGNFTDNIENRIELNYEDIPYFPVNTVKGHAGKLIIGNIGDKVVIAMKGRFHYYEGYSMEKVTFPVRVFKLLGVEKILMFNSSGAINENLEVGDIVIINDYIKLTSQSPLLGKNLDEFGPRFPNMYSEKSEKLKILMEQVFEKNNLPIKNGVFVFMAGPQYETEAEIKMLRILGADIVAMSTVPELIVARHCDIATCAISLVTNSVSQNKNISHKEVIEKAEKHEEQLTKVLLDFFKEV